MKTIGILGGMGPRATVMFEQMLVNSFGGADQSVPTIICLNDGGIPDRTEFILGIGEDPVPRLIKNARILEKAGADFICLPCNTACAPIIFDRLQNEVETPIINLPAKVTEFAQEQGFRSTYLLSTQGTLQAGTYQELFAKNDLSLCIPPEQIFDVVQSVIAQLKKGNLRQARIESIEVREFLISSGADSVVLGCTELPLVKDALVPKSMFAVDTLDVLVKVATSYTGIRKQEEVYDSR